MIVRRRCNGRAASFFPSNVQGWSAGCVGRWGIETWRVLLLRRTRAPGSNHQSGHDDGSGNRQRLRHLGASAVETMIPRFAGFLLVGALFVRRRQHARAVMAADDDVAELVSCRSRRDQQQRGQKRLQGDRRRAHTRANDPPATWCCLASPPHDALFRDFPVCCKSLTTAARHAPAGSNDPVTKSALWFPGS